MTTIDVLSVRIPANDPTNIDTYWSAESVNPGFTENAIWSFSPDNFQIGVGRLFELQVPFTHMSDSLGVNLGSGNGHGFAYFTHINPDPQPNYAIRVTNVMARRIGTDGDTLQICGTCDFSQIIPEIP